MCFVRRYSQAVAEKKPELESSTSGIILSRRIHPRIWTANQGKRWDFWYDP
jgi:hypothetical protein